MKHDPFLLEKDPLAEQAIQRWEELKAERTEFEDDWEHIARLIRPQRGRFRVRADFTNRPFDKPLSSAPIVASSNFASGLYGSLTNPANRWFSMGTPDKDFGNWKPMREWLDVVSTRILASFRPGVGSFYPSSIQAFSDLSAFGNAVVYDESQPGQGRIMDLTLSLAEVVWEVDAFGQVVEVVRRFVLKPKAIVAEYRRAPEKVQDLVDKNSQDKLTLYTHVFRNSDYRKHMLGSRGKRWRSITCLEQGCVVLRDKGYDEMPFDVARWEVESSQSIGTGPGFIALPSSRVIHRMKEANLRSAQFAADKPMLAPNKSTWKLQGSVRPGQTIYNGVNYQGRQMVLPLDNVSQTGLTLEMQNRETEECRDAFHWSLMNIAGRTGMTATEVIERAEERLRMTAPHMGRVQEEYLQPKIARRFAMLWKAGQLPPPPPEAKDVPLEAEYVSAAAMAQKSAEGAAVVRILQDIAPMAQVDPRYVDRIDPDGTVEVLHEARGAPARMLRSREDADALAQQRAEQQQQQQTMEMAQGGASMLKDLAGAGAAMPEGEG